MELSEREQQVLVCLLQGKTHNDLTDEQCQDLRCCWGVTQERLVQITSRLLHRLRKAPVLS